MASGQSQMRLIRRIATRDLFGAGTEESAVRAVCVSIVQHGLDKFPLPGSQRQSVVWACVVIVLGARYLIATPATGNFVNRRYKCSSR